MLTLNYIIKGARPMSNRETAAAKKRRLAAEAKAKEKAKAEAEAVGTEEEATLEGTAEDDSIDGTVEGALDEESTDTGVESSVAPTMDSELTTPEEEKVESDIDILIGGADQFAASYIRRFEKAVTAQFVEAPKIARAMADLIEHCVSVPTRANLSALKRFFIKYKAQLREEVALQKIYTMSPIVKNRVGLVYTLFRNLAASGKPMNLTLASKYLPKEMIDFLVREAD